MNKARRQQLEGLKADIDNLNGTLSDIVSQIESLRDEEQDYKDNMPESFQNGEKGEVADAAISAMDNALSSLSEAETALNDAAGSVEESAG